MKKLSKITESIWADMQDRSTGEIIRDEDKFNPEYVDFGEGTTVYWAVDNLEVDGEVKFYFGDVKDYNNNGWRLPTVDEVNQLKWNIRTPWYEGCKHLKFEDGNELRLKTNGSGGFHMWTNELNKKFPTSAYSYGFDNMGSFNIDSFNKSINKLFVFLVKDKKYVNESIWSDMQDRSTGETIRKEDDIDLLDTTGLVNYMEKAYMSPNDDLKIIGDDKLNFGSIMISLFEKDGKYYNIIYQKISTSNPEITFPVSDIEDSLREHYTVIRPPRYNDKIDYIKPKDGSKVTNKFFLEIVDFILNAIKDNDDIIQMIFKKFCESIWSDMQDRSSGETIRKEDDVNNLDRDGLYDYIYSLYESIDKFPLPLKSGTSPTHRYFSIPIFKTEFSVYRLNVSFENDIIESITLLARDFNVKDFKQALIDNFDVTIKEDGSLKITDKDGKVSNQVCMDLIKTIVENAPEPYLKKREN